MILDRYLIGDATKLNPEQSGVVIRVDKEEDRLGGAAAVAMIAAGLGARVTLAGVIGRDEPGDRLRRLVDTRGIEPHLWVDDRPTTWKQRIVARGQLRPDRCDREVTAAISECVAQFLSAVPLGEMLLVSDYGKGVCMQSLLEVINGRARATGVPVLLDPARGRRWSEYGHVELIKANEEESYQESGSQRLPPLGMARHLSDCHGCHVIITLGRHGMVCAERAGRVFYRPADQVELRDVCGAGDTVLSALGVGLATRLPLRQALAFASTAGAQQVMHTGVTAIEAPWRGSDVTGRWRAII